MQNWNVAAELKRQAQERPEARALGFPTKSNPEARTTWDWWTFARLDAESDAFAAGFEDSGLQKGERTLLLIKPGLEFYAVIFGLLKMDATPVLLDPGMGLRNVLSCIGQIEPRGVVAIPPVHAVRQFVRRPFAKVEHVFTAGRRWFWGGSKLSQVRDLGSKRAHEIAVVDKTDEAAIIFTSGSTGPAKGVSLRHGAFFSALQGIRDMYELGPGHTVVECFAPFAIYDLAMGSTVVIPDMNLSKPATAKPERVVQAIVDHDADTAFASPIVWVNAVRYCQQQGITLPSIQKILSAGAPIPADLHRRFRDIIPAEAEVHTPYGCTEGMPVASVATNTILGDTAALTAKGHGTCVGTLAPGMDVRIVQITEAAMAQWSDELRLPRGEIGELVLCGDVVSPEYKDRPDANRKAKIQDGDRVLHRMGDLGYFDEQGRLWFCGRKAHRLETESGMVPAVPVEGVFNEHPKVLRTALVGVGERGHERPVLCVELEKGETWQEGDETALLKLADGTRWEGRVDTVLLHDAFPVDPRHNSKIKREVLKVWATERAGALVAA